MNAFKAQQARWAKGLMQTAKKILPRVMRADLPVGVKAEAFFHLTANISYPLMVLLSTLLLPAMIVRFYQGWLQMLLIDLAAVSRFELLDFRLLSDRPARALSQVLDAKNRLSAVCHGRGHWPFRSQRQGRARSAFRRAIRVRAHS